MDIIYSKSAIKFLKHIDKNTLKNIKIKIEGLKKIPPEGDIKQLQGYSDNYFRLRIGKYRIIFKYVTQNDVKSIVITNIGSRGDIYK